MHSQLPCHLRIALSPIQSIATLTSVHPNHPTTLAFMHPSHLATSTSIHPSHPATSASIQPPIFHTTMFQPVIGPHHVQTAACHIHTLPHANFILVQLKPKMPNSSDTFHLLVIPHHDDDVIMTSC
jgi:hypothetical protein